MMDFPWTKTVRALGLAALLAAPAAAPAFDEAEPVIEYRQAVMSSLGANTAAIAAVVLDGADYGGNLEAHARYLAEITAELPALFPEGTGGEETGSLPAIWENWETFQARARETSEAAIVLLDAVRAESDQLPLRFRELGQTCRGCHEDFRRKD